MGSLVEHHGPGHDGGSLVGLVIWSALAVCVLAATVYDVGRWVTIW